MVITPHTHWKSISQHLRGTCFVRLLERMRQWQYFSPFTSLQSRVGQFFNLDFGRKGGGGAKILSKAPNVHASKKPTETRANQRNFSISRTKSRTWKRLSTGTMRLTYTSLLFGKPSKQAKTSHGKAKRGRLSHPPTPCPNDLFREQHLHM